MFVAIDLILIAVWAFVIWRSARRGFIRSVIELVGWFLALMLAIWISGLIANAIYTSFIEPQFIKGVQSSVTSFANDHINDDVSAIRDSLPFYLRGVFSDADLSRSITSELSKGSAAAATAIAETLRPALVSIISVMLTFLLMIPLMILVRIAAKYINKVFNLPVIGTINRVLGGILGFFKGILVIYIFVIVINVFMDMSQSKSFLFFTQSAIDRTVLFATLQSLNPFN